jgi:2'-deoxynucleoside 5'-phosphate N-hydrolase
MRIYFGCSMRGGYAKVSREALAAIQSSICAAGCELASDHPTRPGVLAEEARLANVEIHDRDYHWLSESDAGIFEISNPSLGVGAEIADMLHLQKPVLLLVRKGLEQEVSAYVQGKAGSKYVRPRVRLCSYGNIIEARAGIDDFLSELSRS